MHEHIMKRVTMIRSKGGTGSSFIFDYNDRQYIVTAKHLVAGLNHEDHVLINWYDKWESLPVKSLLYPGEPDVAVLAARQQLFVSEPVLTIGGDVRVTIGSECHFLGFPFAGQDQFTKSDDPEVGNSLPFIRRAILSAFDGSAQRGMFYLDGMNNPGFSGGPLLCPASNDPNGIPRLAGIIHGYREQLAPVFSLEPFTPGDPIPPDGLRLHNGSLVKVTRTNQFVGLNSGIVAAWSIKYAIELIEANPIGAPIASAS